MKSLILALAATIAIFGFAGTASAAPPGYGGNHNGHNHGYNNYGHSHSAHHQHNHGYGSNVYSPYGRAYYPGYVVQPYYAPAVVYPTPYVYRPGVSIGVVQPGFSFGINFR